MRFGRRQPEPALLGEPARLHRPLVRKYFLALFAAVTAPLLVSGMSDAWLSFRDARASLDVQLGLEARAAAGRIGGFLDGIRDQLGWAVQLPWSEGADERHRIDALRVLRQLPGIVSLTLVDGRGTERLFISRVGLNRIGGGQDRAAEPAVVGARAARVWYGPVFFFRGSEPFMTLAVAGNRAVAGVAIAEINLKLIWDVVSAIGVGTTGKAFVLDRSGRLIAHPDISLVLRGAESSNSAELKSLADALAAEPGRAVRALDPERRDVLAAAAPVPGVDWSVVAAQPVAEAFAPMVATLWRTAGLLVAGALFAAALAFWLARRMTGPIRLLERGVERIGAGQFDAPIELRTGDELERLAGRVNAMASDLAVSQQREQRIGRLKRFLAPQVAELVERDGEEGLLDGQRAEIVVVFCDLRGFTAFSARAAPDEIMRVLGEYYDALGAVVTAHEATLTSFQGDGLMVLVNAPVRRPDPAATAVRMALDMQEAVQRLIVEWRARGHEIGFGVGLAMGVATIGQVGTRSRFEYTAIGPVVNLASRLCSAAVDGQVLADGAVEEAARPAARMTPIGSQRLKGFDGEIAVYAAEPLAPDLSIPASVSTESLSTSVAT